MPIFPNSITHKYKNNLFINIHENPIDRLHNKIDTLLKEKDLDDISYSMFFNDNESISTLNMNSAPIGSKTGTNKNDFSLDAPQNILRLNNNDTSKSINNLDNCVQKRFMHGSGLRGFLFMGITCSIDISLKIVSIAFDAGVFQIP